MRDGRSRGKLVAAEPTARREAVWEAGGGRGAKAWGAAGGTVHDAGRPATMAREDRQPWRGKAA